MPQVSLLLRALGLLIQEIAFVIFGSDHDLARRSIRFREMDIDTGGAEAETNWAKRATSATRVRDRYLRLSNTTKGFRKPAAP